MFLQILNTDNEKFTLQAHLQPQCIKRESQTKCPQQEQLGITFVLRTALWRQELDFNFCLICNTCCAVCLHFFYISPSHLSTWELFNFLILAMFKYLNNYSWCMWDISIMNVELQLYLIGKKIMLELLSAEPFFLCKMQAG